MKTQAAKLAIIAMLAMVIDPLDAQASDRKLIPVTKERCESMSSRNGIATMTAEFVAKQAKVSPSSVDLWKTQYDSSLKACHYYFDTPVGLKTCWSGVAKSESEEITWLLGKPMRGVLVQDPGETPFLVLATCLDFR